MYFFDFLSQYNRFLEDKVSTPDFVHWLFTYNDEMEQALNDDEWELFAKAQHLAAELTSELISESTFRDMLLTLQPEIDRRAAVEISTSATVVGLLTKGSSLWVGDHVVQVTRSVSGQVLSLAAVGTPKSPAPVGPQEVAFGARP